MQKVLITGATGMLGSSIKNIALKHNWNFFSPTSKELDLRDSGATLSYIQRHDIQVVIHCAAKVGGIQANIDFPADFIMENLKIDISIINGARIARVPKFIYFGSSCMYPRFNKQPMIEEDILGGNLEPTNEGYALAKIVSAKAIQSIVQQDGLKWRILIPSNLYGPGDNFDLETSHLVPAIINKITYAVRNDLDSIEIWGSGKARREFTYVQDVAQFVIENISNSENWETMMNIGFGKDYSINDYYESVGKLLGYKGRFVNLVDRPEGMKLKLMDSTKAIRHGWNPLTDLECGLERTIEWFQAQIRE